MADHSQLTAIATLPLLQRDNVQIPISFQDEEDTVFLHDVQVGWFIGKKWILMNSERARLFNILWKQHVTISHYEPFIK